MKKRCRNEVDQLHMFFQDWFTGAAVPSDESFGRVSSVLADEFQLISPRGVVCDRASILKDIRGAHGKRPEFSIRVEKFSMSVQSESLAVATYEEWQDGDENTGRVSTVVLRVCPGTPNGVQWVHVHETWLPGHAPAPSAP